MLHLLEGNLSILSRAYYQIASGIKMDFCGFLSHKGCGSILAVHCLVMVFSPQKPCRFIYSCRTWKQETQIRFPAKSPVKWRHWSLHLFRNIQIKYSQRIPGTVSPSPSVLNLREFSPFFSALWVLLFHAQYHGRVQITRQNRCLLSLGLIENKLLNHFEPFFSGPTLGLKLP